MSLLQRFTLFIILLFFVTVGTGKWIYHLKDGFTFRRIYGHSLIISDDFDEETRSALSQTFRYLGRGRQCFAFASVDDRYVLKLPRTDIYKLPLWLRILPFLSHRSKLNMKHKDREQFLLKSFHISYEKLKSETATLALHLGQSASIETLTIIDAMGIKHHLPLGKTSFVLQYKHPSLIEAFQNAVRNQNFQESERILVALVDLIAERATHGVLNRDRSFLRNYGFDGQKAYQIDIGSFCCDETMSPRAIFLKSFCDSIDPIHDWLAENYPEELPLFNDLIAKKIH